MSNYSQDAKWADVVPLPQDDGGPNPLAAIAYTDRYSEAMSYLRAIMAKNEMSERALELTEDIIDMNAAHYTVWLYRARILQSTNADLVTELAWLNRTALAHQKNYQIWQHRQLVIDRLDSADGEAEFMDQMFDQDAKNYHVWSYRQWLVQRFALWESDQGGQDTTAAAATANGELKATEKFIEADVRNNSAWNHRFFVVNGNTRDKAAGRGGVGHNAAIRDREIAFAQQAIRRAPQNQSPWNYLRGTLDAAGLPLSSVQEFVLEFASLGDDGRDGGEVLSSHALDLLAEIYAQEGKTAEAGGVYRLLASKYDPIRANYWDYLRAQLPAGVAAATAA